MSLLQDPEKALEQARWYLNNRSLEVMPEPFFWLPGTSYAK